ncbi:MAG: CRTAC1 family protein [Acidobacteriota bacterium]
MSRRLAVALMVASICSAAPIRAGASFTERAAEVGLLARYSAAPGFDFSEFGTMVSLMVGGGAVGDFNNDGFTDVFVLGGGNEPDRLFINQRDGSFVESAAEWGIASYHLGIGASAVDFNGDGWVDIYVTSFGPADQARPGQHRLYENRGGNRFVDVGPTAGVNQTSPDIADGFGSAWGDYDLDGDLDLFVCGWLPGSDGNRLFRNNGDDTFTDVTVAAGFTDQEIRGFTPRFVDMDGDRYPELLIAADLASSRYYKNNQGRNFTNLAPGNGTGLDGNGMGQTVGDLNGDGALDWYVTSIFSDDSGIIHVPGTGNMLYLNLSGDDYVEWGTAAGLRDGGWGWAAMAIDMDNDGDLDVLEVNGWPGNNGFGVPEWNQEQAYVFRNDGNLKFVEVALSVGVTHDGQGRGLSGLDYDNDGDLDFVLFSVDQPIQFYENNTGGSDSHWIRVFLSGEDAAAVPPHGVGSVVTITANNQPQRRFIDAGSNYLSSNELSAHFGLGRATLIEELRVDWSNGDTSIITNVGVDQTVTLEARRLRSRRRQGWRRRGRPPSTTATLPGESTGPPKR